MSPVRLFKGKRESKEQDETDSPEMAVDVNALEDTTAEIEPEKDTSEEAEDVAEVEEVEEVEAEVGETAQVGDDEPQDQELGPALAEVEYDPVSELLAEDQQSDSEEVSDDEDESALSTQIVNSKSEEPEEMESDNLMNLSHDAMTTEMMSDFSESQSTDIKACEMILEFSQIKDGLGGWSRDTA